MSAPFMDFNLGHLVELGGLVMVFVTYRLDRKKDAKERGEAREKMIENQTRMHADNTNKLETLAQFHAAQQLLNAKRDEQIFHLINATTTLTQMAAGQERRLQMLENNRT